VSRQYARRAGIVPDHGGRHDDLKVAVAPVAAGQPLGRPEAFDVGQALAGGVSTSR
jgi:hypothetical protein